MVFRSDFETGDLVITINCQKIQQAKVVGGLSSRAYVDIGYPNGYRRSVHKSLVLPYEEIKKSNIPYEIIYCYLHLADILASNGYDIRNSIRYLYDRLCIKYPRICYSKKKSEFMDKIDNNISKAIVIFNENFVEAINTFCYNDSVRDKYAELYNSVTERLNEKNG